jgi:outer membrane protein assembly factor BamA
VVSVPLLAGAPAAGGVPAASPTLSRVDYLGGSEDDLAYARMAGALAEGGPLGPDAFPLALAAIRRTDRFRRVEGSLTLTEQGTVARIQLDPWPVLEQLTLEGAAKSEMSGLRVNRPLGDQRLEVWRRQFQTRLREAGYPQAQVSCERTLGDRGLRVFVQKGAPALVTRVEVSGRTAPYSPEQLIKIAKVVPGKTLWTASSHQELLGRLRTKLIKADRYECQVDVAWAEGVLHLAVDAGPVVQIRSEGDGIGWTSNLKDMVGLARANRYSPELLDEADRRIYRALRGKGYLDAQVEHRREILRGTPERPEQVRVTFRIRRGPSRPIYSLEFEGNHDLSEAELRKAADLPYGWFSIEGPKATPELMDDLETRIKAAYISRGYTEVTVRLQPLRRVDEHNQLVYRIAEGPRRMLRWLRLELPAGGFGDPWGLGECLTRLLADKPLRVRVGLNRRYSSDLPAMAGIEGVLELQESAAGTALTLTLNRPVPLLKSDLAKIFSALRQQRLPALGVVHPSVRLALVDGPDGTGIQLVVPDQPRQKVERLVVMGSLKTHAHAVLRETQLQPGGPLDLSTLSRSQARLSYLGAFQRVDLTNLADVPSELLEPVPEEPKPESAPKEQPSQPDEPPRPAGPPVPWGQGDLLLRVDERPPWVVNHSFGYDSVQGYYFGNGIQWLNVGGMGRTVDMGLRAGNGTIDNPTLRKWFPTGPYVRSVDSFSVGYTDPWFEPIRPGWLPDRTQLATEAAYIQEERSLYLLHRRRVTGSLQWLLTPRVSLQTGYRFERVDTAPAQSDIDPLTLAKLARYPQDATISAPFVQIARDTRDNALDPTKGSYSVARLELANQLFLTSRNASFVKLDLRQQWTWPVGTKAWAGVVALGMRVGMARPTAATADNLPLAERFFAGGSFTQRGVEPDGLGPLTNIPLVNPSTQELEKDAYGNQLYTITPLGGQGLALVNLEYRFPLFSKTVWGELFVDSGQVYSSLTRLSSPVLDVNGVPLPQSPPFRTSAGFGLIFRLAIPIKLEYAADIKRLLGEPRNPDDVATQLKGISISAGFQF